MEFRDSKGYLPLIENALFYCEGEMVWLPASFCVFTGAMTFFPLLVLWFLTPPIFKREKLHQYKGKKTKRQSNRCITKLSYLDICCRFAGQHIRSSSRYVDYNLRFQNKDWHICIQFYFEMLEKKNHLRHVFISLTDLGSCHTSIN